jgi:hypothetical protein
MPPRKGKSASIADAPYRFIDFTAANCVLDCPYCRITAAFTAWNFRSRHKSPTS